MNFENLKDMKEFCKYNKIDVASLLWDTCEKSQEKIEALKAENESLTKQLENSVPLPCKVGDTVWIVYTKDQRYPADIEVQDIIYKNMNGKISIRVEDNHMFGGIISDEMTTVFTTKEAAEKRLKELQGDK